MNLISAYKKYIIIVCILFFITISIFLFVKNDYALYDDTIGTVMQVNTKYNSSIDVSSLKKDKVYTQTLKIKLRNGKYEGEYIEITNKYSETQIKETKYSKGDDLFIIISKTSNSISGKIKNVKRDHYVVLLFMMFLFSLLILTKKQGILTLASLIVNSFIFLFAIFNYAKGNFLGITTLFVIIGFCVFTLFILCGINIKSIGAVLSSLITTALIYLIYCIVCETIDSNLPYEMIPYMVDTNNLTELFMIGTTIGCLGAIMDVSITMNSSLHELVAISPSITLKELISSAREIGYDIMGTMINVLFFTYVSGCLPMTILKFKNNYTFTTLLRYDIFFDAVRFLVGSIGIVMAIPVSTFIAILFSKRKMVKKHVINS